MLLGHLTKPKDEGGKPSEKYYKTNQIAQACQSTRWVKWASWLLWSLRVVPYVRIIFSKRTLATKEAVACLQEKASVQ